MTISIWISALFLAVLAAAIDFDGVPGIAWPLWTVPAALALYYYARQGRPDAARDIVVPLALAVLISAGGAVTTSDPLHFFIVVASVLLFAYAARLAAGAPVALAGAGFIAASPIIGAFASAHESWERTTEAANSANAGRAMPALRGTLIATPIVIVLWLLLAAADPNLSSWGQSIATAIRELAFVPRLVFGIAIGVLSLGTFGLALRATDAPAAAAEPAGHAAATERIIILGAVATLFAVFCALQLPVMFGNPAAAAGSGVTYADWVHRGFGELTTAATIVTVLIVALDALAARGSERQERVARALAYTLLALTAFVVLSAFRRITLYEAAYGYTVQRLWSQMFMVCVWIALLLSAVEIARGLDARRLARRGSVVGALALATLIYWNTGAFIVRENVARYAQTGKLDTWYLAAGLSLDALPAVLEARSSLPQTLDDSLTALVRSRVECSRALKPGAWYEYNMRRWEAIRVAGGQQLLTAPAKSCHSSD
jgi:hypothetical protein